MNGKGILISGRCKNNKRSLASPGLPFATPFLFLIPLFPFRHPHRRREHLIGAEITQREHLEQITAEMFCREDGSESRSQPVFRGQKNSFVVAAEAGLGLSIDFIMGL